MLYPLGYGRGPTIIGIHGPAASAGAARAVRRSRRTARANSDALERVRIRPLRGESVVREADGHGRGVPVPALLPGRDAGGREGPRGAGPPDREIGRAHV